MTINCLGFCSHCDGTDPGAVVGLGLQLVNLCDLLEEVGLLHAGLRPPALELGPRVRQDHLKVNRETCERQRG